MPSRPPPDTRVLTPHDMQDVLQALRVIGEAESIVDFAERVCRELLRLVPGVSASYNEVNLPALRVSAVVHPDPGREWFDQYAGIFEANLRDNPIVQYFAVTGEDDVVTWADLDPGGAFLQTVLYREFYAPNGIHSQIAFLLPAPPGIHVGLAINRDGTDFTDRERALLAELRPHLVNLYRLVSHAEASRYRDAALAADGWSVVLVNDNGIVLESNPAAEAIGQAVGIELGAGADLRKAPFWPALSDQDWSRLDRGTSVEVRLVRSPVGPHVLWIREPSRVTVEDAIALGLTRRQAEVAVLLVDGLTTESIAKRLVISAGTVRTHLDGIFRRLGVSSRAAVVGRLLAGSGGDPSTRDGDALS